MSKPVWRECDCCDGDGGWWREEPTHKPIPRAADPRVDAIRKWSSDLMSETLRVSTLADLTTRRKR